MIKSNTKKGLILLLSVFMSILAIAQDISTDAGVISSGQELFGDNCTQCHAIGMKVVGPALKNVHKRRSVEWIKLFITNSQKLINSGDKDAKAIYKEFNKTEMPSHQFSDDELNSIIAYLKDASENEIAPVKNTSNTDEKEVIVEETDSTEMVIMGMAVAILLILIVILYVVNNMLKKQLLSTELNEDESEMVNQSSGISFLWKAKWVKTLLIVIVILYAIGAGVDFVMGIGIQQGYKPTQPINFSHKIHAGDNEIDCNYCHTGVRKSKHANLPSANICMNCHSTVKKDSPEIKKIYDAIKNNQPIEWIRIHNLPDFAYFNHSQHVKVGGVECKTCHGPIEEMDVVEQHTKLTMGWCIECHRNTPLNTKGNAYYDDLVKAHKEAKGSEPFNVVDNGGMECARCHY